MSSVVMPHRVLIPVALVLAVLASACGTGQTNAAGTAAGQDVTVTVNPKAATVGVSGQQAFDALVTGTANTAVTWSLQEGAAAGSIAAGLYTAPAAPGTFHVVATSAADPTKSTIATVTVQAAAPIVVTVSPKTAALTTGGKVTFSATVTGTSNTAVAWSVLEASGCGTITSAGAYTAPAAAATCHVVATSAAQATQTDVATVTVTAPTPVSVSVSPSSPTVNECKTLTFTATVTGSTDTAVAWSVQEGAAGGTITAGGVYTAASAGTYHVVATSHADPSKSATATVAVTTSVLSVAINPATVTVSTGGTAQFTATVTTTCGAFTATQTVGAAGIVALPN